MMRGEKPAGQSIGGLLMKKKISMTELIGWPTNRFFF